VFGSKPDYSKVKDPYQQVQEIDPSLPNLTGKVSSNISSYLSGQLPTDVLDEIRNSGAAWGVKSGMPGSGAANNVTLESLGLNSLDLMEKGQGDYMNFLTGVGSTTMPVQEQMTAANAAAAPNPAAAGLFDLGVGTIGSILGMVGGGGAAGGMGGSGGMAYAPTAGTDFGDPYGYGTGGPLEGGAWDMSM
jgi:hypothetical protein